MAEGGPDCPPYLPVVRWVADNFCVSEGCTVPHRLVYELYLESCSPDSKYQVNSATFGKLIRLVFPGLRSKRLGPRGSTRYHYIGITIKKNSSFYARYCCLLYENNDHRMYGGFFLCHIFYHNGNACSYGDAAGRKSNSKKTRTSKNLHCSPSVIYLKSKRKRFQYLWAEFSRSCLREQDLGKTYPYEMVVLLAHEYCSHCQHLLHMVRNSKFNKVEGCIMSFWKSLRPEIIPLMSLPDVCQMLKSYDRQLFKEMEKILLDDFLEEVPIQHMRSIRLFSKNVKLWLLNALVDFPLPLQTSKSEEVTVFIKRLRRKTDLSNLAKTMRTVLENNSKVTVLRSGLHVVIDQGFLDVPGILFQNKLRNLEELQNNIELKCLKDLVSLLSRFTDIQLLLECVASNLQAFFTEPSRSKEEFREAASAFQLRWSFLLSGVSKAMTLNCSGSFGSWHLLSMLLMDFVAHVFLSYLEKGEEDLWVPVQNESAVLCVYDPSHLGGYFSEQWPQASAPQAALITSMENQSNSGISKTFPDF
ncbi:DNA-binding protein RFX8 [Falco cherrug]|uniref:DNA-binding protein RFX8 n=1 Tax=Falco cherrug TaxID=345164 RepID=UPI002478CF8D|nr:DNA-binding protein RFX8 [Falco cherrug]